MESTPGIAQSDVVGIGPIRARARLSRKHVLIGSVALALVLLGTYFGYESFFYVSTENAMIEARTTLLSPKVSGIIIKSSVHENEKVKAGQVLAEIDPDNYQETLDELQSQQQALTAELNGAQVDYQRIQRLYKHGAIAQRQLDDAQTRFLTLQARVKSADAQVSAAQLNLQDTKILAPTNGIVGRKSFEVGMLASVGQPLMGFVEGNTRWVDANLKETDLADISRGKKAYITVDALPGEEFKGVVESISPTTGATFSLLPPDNATGNFTKVVQRVPVRIKLLGLTDYDVRRLQSGLSAEVKIKIR